MKLTKKKNKKTHRRSIGRRATVCEYIAIKFLYISKRKEKKLRERIEVVLIDGEFKRQPTICFNDAIISLLRKKFYTRIYCEAHEGNGKIQAGQQQKKNLND